jgi:hypothetical protein
MEGTFIEIQSYGDFDIKYTDCIMYSTERRDVKAITKAFCDQNGLPGTSGLPSNMLSTTTEAFKKYLKKEGFSQLKTNEVCFGD